MEPTKLTMGELRKMEEGEIPMTEDGKQQIVKLKEQLSVSTNFNALTIAKSQNLIFSSLSASTLSKLSESGISKSIIFPKPLIPEFFTNPQVSRVFADQMEKQREAMHTAVASIASVASQWQINQETIRKSITSFSTVLGQIRIDTGHLGELLKRIKNDPELKRRFELFGEKEKTIRSVITRYKDQLIHRIEHRPFETFAYQFEYACYDLLDDARNNEQLAAISERDFIYALQYVADRIVKEEKHKLENWVKSNSKSPLIKKRRVNSEAAKKRKDILAKYDNYITQGGSHKTAIQKLLHDFRLEYKNTTCQDNRKKDIERIIRDRNKTEQ